VGPEALLMVYVRGECETKSSHVMFRDGAIATACLPVHIAQRYLRGEIVQTGILTPLDLAARENLPEITEGALIGPGLK
jgi:hypothetical protein